jgi:hypothetical protein
VVGDAAQENPYQKIVLAKKNGAPALAFLCLLQIACSDVNSPAKGANAPQNERSAAKAANRRRVRLRKVRASAIIW